MSEERDQTDADIRAQIARCRGLLREYRSLGIPGYLGRMAITTDIENAEFALNYGNAHDKTKALGQLRLCK